ncbi:MAG: flavin reductase [Clostridium sp.]|nr:flavin reductase [Lachnoclostridium sp.]MCM1251452.1 flavin reductase [Clostridium sp.]
MHTFQPFPMNELEFNPFEKIGKEWALISAGSKQEANTMTISWGGVGVLWGKNVVFLFVRDSRYTKEFIDTYDLLSVSFLNQSYKDALNYCGSHSGRYEDKVEAAGLTWNYKHSIPFIDEGNLVFLCQKLSATRITEESFLSPHIKDWYTDGDMHTMYVAEIIEVLAR